MPFDRPSSLRSLSRPLLLWLLLLSLALLEWRRRARGLRALRTQLALGRAAALTSARRFMRARLVTVAALMQQQVERQLEGALDGFAARLGARLKDPAMPAPVQRTVDALVASLLPDIKQECWRWTDERFLPMISPDASRGFRGDALSPFVPRTARPKTMAMDATGLVPARAGEAELDSLSMPPSTPVCRPPLSASLLELTFSVPLSPSTGPSPPPLSPRISPFRLFLHYTAHALARLLRYGGLILRRWRAAVLYTLWPCDRSIWASLRKPSWWALQAIGHMPLLGQLWWLMLAMLVDRRDEYQLCAFVVGLRVSHFVGLGLGAAAYACVQAYRCTLVAAAEHEAGVDAAAKHAISDAAATARITHAETVADSCPASQLLRPSVGAQCSSCSSGGARRLWEYSGLCVDDPPSFPVNACAGRAVEQTWSSLGTSSIGAGVRQGGAASACVTLAPRLYLWGAGFWLLQIGLAVYAVALLLPRTAKKGARVPLERRHRLPLVSRLHLAAGDYPAALQTMSQHYSSHRNTAVCTPCTFPTSSSFASLAYFSPFSSPSTAAEVASDTNHANRGVSHVHVCAALPTQSCCDESSHVSGDATRPLTSSIARSTASSVANSRSNSPAHGRPEPSPADAVAAASLLRGGLLPRLGRIDSCLAAVTGFAALLACAFLRGDQLSATLFWIRTVHGLLSCPYVFFKLPLLDTLLTHARKTGYDQLGHTVPFRPASRHVQLQALPVRSETPRSPSGRRRLFDQTCGGDRAMKFFVKLLSLRIW